MVSPSLKVFKELEGHGELSGSVSLTFGLNAVKGVFHP